MQPHGMCFTVKIGLTRVGAAGRLGSGIKSKQNRWSWVSYSRSDWM